ncbi:G-D-S-L family lipolytic protein, partial [Sphingomonas sp. LH128]|uniref:hypothetical protein n=1 Tax=Sphingomonas sp. LH128 TaxID=473781 RepID=UPI00027CC1E9
MAVSTDNAFSGPYLANGVTTVFPFTFTAPSAAEVAVLVRNAAGDDVAAGSFTVALNPGGAAGGSISFDVAPANGLSVVPLLTPEFTQDLSFADGSAWLAAPVNEGYDRAALRAQALKRDVDRALKAPIGSDGLEFGAISDGQVLALVADKIRGIDNDPAFAEDAAQRAENALGGALVAEGGAVAAKTGAETALGATQVERLLAQQAANSSASAALSSQGYYPAARSFVPQGASTGALAITTPGSGGANGTFALAFTGGNFAVNPSGTFTVAGGVVTAINITGPGLYIGNAISSPALSFAASAGLAGAAATLATRFLKASGEYYLTDSTAGTDYVALFQNVGNVATLVSNALDWASAGKAAGYAAQAAATMAGIDAPAVASAVYRKNLFNLATLTDNNFVTSTGALSANAQFFASDWIAWPAGVTQVTLSRGNWLVQATYSAGVYTAIAGSSINPNSQVYTLNKAAGATHFRLSSQKANQPAATFMAVPGATLPTDYVPYDRVLDLSKAMPSSMPGTALVPGAVTPDKASFLAASKNILNLTGLTVGMALSNAGSPLASAQNSYTTYLPVTPGQQYTNSQNGTVTNMRMWCFFANTSGTVVSGGSNDPGSTFTPPAGANYVRVTLYNAATSGGQLEAGASATPYVAYGYKLSPDGYGSSGSGGTNGWYGKTLAILGDSITQGNTWQGYLAAKRGVIITSFGIGGTRLSGPAGDTNAMCQDARINAIPTTVDAMMCMPG